MLYLDSLDILVTVNTKQDLFSKFKRWLMGPYDHVGVYLGPMGTSEAPELFPAVFESVGRGILIRDMRSWQGTTVVQMQLSASDLAEHERDILIGAVDMASKYGAHYDYPAIIRWAIPRIIMQKLKIPIPQTWKRDGRHICSEAAYSLFYDNGISFFTDTQIPMPEDFVKSPELFQNDTGIIKFDGIRPYIFPDY